MDKAARVRWFVLLSMLIACIVATLYPDDDEQVSTRPHKTAAESTTATLPPVTGPPDVPYEDPDAIATDPFAPRGWNAPPPPAPSKPPPTQAMVLPEAPVGPPPLPFQFVGRLRDGATQMVYLSRGDQTLIARAGEELDATYKVLRIETSFIAFEYTPTGVTQMLALPTSDN